MRQRRGEERPETDKKARDVKIDKERQGDRGVLKRDGGTVRNG